MDEITIRVPATTANLGPGFDCLGIALQLENRIRVRRALAGCPVVQGSEMLREAGAEFFAACGVEPFDFSVQIEGEVPQARGLGSSVTVRLGVLHGLDALAGAALGSERLYEICADLEGHPDNAAPAAFGGFAASKMGHRPVLAPVDDALAFVLLIPEFPTLTEDARRVLPGAVPFTGAVESCINAARISAAFVRRDYEALRGAFGDHLHQPYREPLVPFLSKVIAAAEKAGALGGWLSGSGSTICCITLGEPAPVAEAMLAAAASPGARVVITKADNSGCEAIAASKSTSTSPA